MSDDASMDDKQASLDTLEEAHSFPCEYDFKVIGTNSASFVESVVDAGTSVAGPDTSPEIETKESSDDSYVSVTMTVTVDTAEMVLDIYEEVQDIDEMKFVL